MIPATPVNLFRTIERPRVRGSKRTIVALAVAAFLGNAATAHADDIVLREYARFPSDRSVVRLCDVADLKGPEAAKFSDLIVAEPSDSTGTLEITLRQVRDLLDSAGAHWGRINLSGSAVTVRSRRSANTSAPAAMAAVSLAPAGDHDAADTQPQHVDTAESLMDSPTVGGAAARLIAAGLQIAPRDLQLVLDQRDEPLWLTASDKSRFEIDPLSGVRSDRIELVVRTWTDGLVQSRSPLTVRPLIQTRASTLRRDVNRGDRLDGDVLSAQTLWLPPSQSAGALPPDEVVGRITTRRLHAGDIVHQQHVRSEYVIERGARTMVRCLVGGVVITLQAEAQADGARGDSIEFRKLGERQTFLAMVSGPGEAVVDLGR